MKTEYLIVGSGLTGATIARILADQGKKVLVLERRPHISGNVHDHRHESGIDVHTYGPHYFRTSSERIWNFLNRFTTFYPYEASLLTEVNGRLENWPIHASYLKRTEGENWQPSFTGEPKNFEEASLAMMPRGVYENFVEGYTKKQWGVEPRQLEASLAGRFDVREDNDPRLKKSKYQGIPSNGYTVMVKNILDGIPVKTGVDFFKVRDSINVEKWTIFTGPIDEYFNFDLGYLRYRGQIRNHQYFESTEYHQPVGQVNFPSPDIKYVRALEWKHMMPPEAQKRIKGTLLTTETPFDARVPDEYEYPFPDNANSVLYKKYLERADKIEGLLICGRLGEYKYYDMDQAIARAMKLADSLLSRNTVSPAELKKGVI